MKKTYIAPTMQAFTMQMTQKLCVASLKTNAELEYEGEIPDGFDSDNVRSREFNSPMDNWSEWDESEEEQY